jgi:hypothetical protein
MGNYHPISMKIGTHSEKHAEFKNHNTGSVGQVLRWPPPFHFVKSSKCCKMGNYQPISMKIGTQTKKNIPSSEITKTEA